MEQTACEVTQEPAETELAVRSGRTWVSVDLDALQHNAGVACELAGHPVMAVVKANAYGHGLVEVSRALENRPTVAGFGVASLDEALSLRESGLTKPLYVLGACLPDEREAAVAADLNVLISDRAEAENYARHARRLGRKVEGHVAVDTGMGRLGVPEERCDTEWLGGLRGIDGLEWVGFASHLPSADEDDEFTRRQVGRFRQLADRARAVLPSVRQVHLCNSAGIMTLGRALSDVCTLSRPGLMLYGVAPVAAHAERLRAVLRWSTRVTMARDLPAGHGISYGRTEVTRRPTRVVTLAVGYGDGYPRAVSGSGASVLIQGRPCPLLGRVTMDQIMVDGTDLPVPPEPGDEAVLLGVDGEQGIDAAELARWAGTIPWEIFTGISRRVRRLFSGGD